MELHVLMQVEAWTSSIEIAIDVILRWSKKKEELKLFIFSSLLLLINDNKNLIKFLH